MVNSKVDEALLLSCILLLLVSNVKLNQPVAFLLSKKKAGCLLSLRYADDCSSKIDLITCQALLRAMSGLGGNRGAYRYLSNVQTIVYQ